MTTISSSKTPATRLANILSNNQKECELFVNYFQNNSSGQERQATLDQIVEFLHQDEKRNDFFKALDDILRQEGLITKANDGPIPSNQIHFDPIQDIVEALYNAGINVSIFHQIHTKKVLLKNSTKN